uniref:RING-type E3 ubiquitin transferase n=1 Tax=Nomascus leucogenys TaxID=61853 RepID=A0A2I3HWN7_NOMLE
VLLSIGMLMLSATQVYSILAVQLFAFLNLLPVEADILAYNFENTSQTFDDLPARFGYRLPAEGLKGFLINSKPENACEPIVPPPVKNNSSGTFIVLNAQRAEYKAAIVHNVDSDDLISIGSNDIEVLKKIDILSVFIGESSANSLKDEFTYEKGGHLILVPEFSLPLECCLISFLIIVGICLILIVIFMFLDRHRARRNRLCEDQLKKLPIRKFKKGDEYDVCAIYGDKLRILPCSHLINASVPVCKQTFPSQGHPDSDTDASVSAQSFGALSESHSYQNMTKSSDYDEDDNEDTNSSDEENETNEHNVAVQLQPNCEWDYNIAVAGSQGPRTGGLAVATAEEHKL